MNNDRFYEEDFNSFLQHMIDSKRLEPIQEGITKLVIDKGYDALSVKQKKVFDYMIETNFVEKCKLDEIDIPWCEMFEALDNGGYCIHCQHIMEDIEK